LGVLQAELDPAPVSYSQSEPTADNDVAKSLNVHGNTSSPLSVANLGKI
jgi:hypothetical protein